MDKKDVGKSPVVVGRLSLIYDLQREFVAKRIAEARKAVLSPENIPDLRRLIDLAPKYKISQEELESVRLPEENASRYAQPIGINDRSLLLADGKTSEKIVGGENRVVKCFLRVNRYNDLEGLAVGYVDIESGKEFAFSPIVPYNPLRFLRAMQLLELVPAIDQTTITDCYAAATLKVDEEKAGKVGKINQLIGREKREALVQSIPKNLYSILQTMRRSGFMIFSDDLVELLEGNDIEHGREILLMMMEDILALEYREEVRRRRAITGVGGVIDLSKDVGTFNSASGRLEEKAASNNHTSPLVSETQRTTSIKIDIETYQQTFYKFEEELLKELAQSQYNMTPKTYGIVIKYSNLLSVSFDFLSDISEVLGIFHQGVLPVYANQKFDRMSARISARGPNFSEYELLVFDIILKKWGPQNNLIRLSSGILRPVMFYVYNPDAPENRTEYSIIDIQPTFNFPKPPKSFRLPSTSGKERFIIMNYHNDWPKIQDEFCNTICTALAKGNFLEGFRFRKRLDVEITVMLLKSSLGGLISPEHFIARVGWITVDNLENRADTLKMVKSDDYTSGYYYFDVQNNTFIKITDPDDLEILRFSSRDAGRLIIVKDINGNTYPDPRYC